jgi:hypothetical protein
MTGKQLVDFTGSWITDLAISWYAATSLTDVGLGVAFTGARPAAVR